SVVPARRGDCAAAGKAASNRRTARNFLESMRAFLGGRRHAAMGLWSYSRTLRRGQPLNGEQVRSLRRYVPVDPAVLWAALAVCVGYYLAARLGFAFTLQPHP